MKKIIAALSFLMIASTSAIPAVLEDLQIKKLDTDRIKHFPVPVHSRNYFFLQSVDNRTQILIGDFLHNDKQRIILITLDKDYKTIKSVVEYDPKKRNIRTRKTSESPYFNSDIAKLKKDIITGAIFNDSHSDRMKSYDALETVFKKNEAMNILPDTYGFTVKLSEVDEENRPMAMFTFGKSETGYYLQFKTEYIRINSNHTEIPLLIYSVYCKDTQDPDIKEVVEELFKIREPAAYKTRQIEKSN